MQNAHNYSRLGVYDWKCLRFPYLLGLDTIVKFANITVFGNLLCYYSRLCNRLSRNEDSDNGSVLYVMISRM